MRLPGYGFTAGCDRVARTECLAASGDLFNGEARFRRTAPASPSSLSPGDRPDDGPGASETDARFRLSAESFDAGVARLHQADRSNSRFRYVV